MTFKITIVDFFPTRREIVYKNRKKVNEKEAIQNAMLKAFGTKNITLFQNYNLPKGYGSFINKEGTVYGDGYIKVEIID
jgi:hypothetical protein